jgi:hypothetical protein
MYMIVKEIAILNAGELQETKPRILLGSLALAGLKICDRTTANFRRKKATNLNPGAWWDKKSDVYDCKRDSNPEYRRIAENKPMDSAGRRLQRDSLDSILAEQPSQSRREFTYRKLCQSQR